MNTEININPIPYRILRENSGNEHSPDWRDDDIIIKADSPSEAIQKAIADGVFGYDFDAVEEK